MWKNAGLPLLRRRLLCTVSSSSSSNGIKENRLVESAKLMLKRLEAAPDKEKRQDVLQSSMNLMKNRSFWKPLIQTLQKKSKNKLLCVEVFDWIRREIPDVAKSQIYANMIAFAGSLRKPQLAYDWLSEMKSKGIKMSTSTYNALLSVLCRTGELEAAVEMVEKMKSADDCPPNISTYNTILAAYGRNIKISQMELWLEEFKSKSGLTPNTVTYNTLLFSYFKKGRLRKVEETYKEMQGAGCKPDVFTFGILLHGYEKVNMVEKMEAAFANRQRSGLSVSPIAAQRMIQIYARNKMFDKLKSLLKWFPKSVFTTRINTLIVEAYMKSGDIRAAESQMGRVLRQRKAFVDPQVLEEFIRRISDSPGKLEKLYQRLKSVARWKLSSSTYELLVGIFAKDQDHDRQAKMVLMISADMEEAGWKWSVDTMQVLYQVFKQTGDRRGLEIIVERMKAL